MNCARCETHIPDGSSACPGCGLKLRAVPGGEPTSPGAALAHEPAASPPMAEQTPGSSLSPPMAEPPPGQYFSPGDVHAVGSYMSPEVMLPPEPHLTVGGTPPGGMASGAAPARTMDSSTRYLIIACVAALIIIGALAGFYFTVLKKAEATEPEKTVLKYFESLSSGDINAFVSCFTQQAAPDQATIVALQKTMSTGMFKYDNVKLKTLSQTPTNAEVQIKDFTVKATGGGQTAQMKMSKLLSGSSVKLKLVNSNGTWLIDSKYQYSSNGSMF